MAAIPENTVTMQDMVVWYELKKQLASLKTQESLMRRKIFGHCFPEPTEGTNSYELPDGYVLKGTHVLNRDVDRGALDAGRTMLQEHGLNVDKLLDFKPSLVKREYNKLTAEEKKVFDQILIVKEGSPQLEIVQPKRKGK